MEQPQTVSFQKSFQEPLKRRWVAGNIGGSSSDETSKVASHFHQNHFGFDRQVATIVTRLR
jgi:hypothetical protein